MKKRPTKLILLPALLAMAINMERLTLPCKAQGTAFTFQGQLQRSGSPATGTYNLTFSLFNTNTTGTAIAGPVTNNGVSVNNGLFMVTIDFGASVWNGQTNWLQIGVETNGASPFTVLTPRQQITPAPYAIVAAGIAGVVANNSASGSRASVAGGFQNAALSSYSTVSGGLSNSATADSGFVGGGVINSAKGYADVVVGGQANTNSGMYTFIGGGQFNSASDNWEVLAGGQFNQVSGTMATIGGGHNNSASGYGSTVAGGGDDGASSPGNNANGSASTVGGGIGNTAGGSYTTVSGGNGNSAGGDNSWIGGGNGNGAAGAGDAIGGGFNNSSVGGNNSTIGGGTGNNSSGSGAFIGGGLNNSVSSLFASIAGGVANLATNDLTSVGGGTNNVSAGYAATIPGGANNYAEGDYSLAAGSDAQATNNNCFVWSDGSAETDSTAANQFVARSSGGFMFYTGSGGAGAKLPAGATSWSVLSDRNAKKNFQAVDTLAVLNSLCTIPIQKWNYKWEPDQETPHIGPMAQDFKAAFYPGEDDKSISTLEFDGVELAAIQGLNQKLARKDAEIQDLKEQLDQLRILVKQLADNQTK